MIYLFERPAAVTDAELGADLAALPAWRRYQALRYTRPIDRVLCAKAYLLLADALRRDWGVLDQPAFAYGDNGKPRLAGVDGLHFNLSHCEEAVVCVVDRSPVGVDVECVRHYDESFHRFTMNDNELHRIAEADSPDIEFLRLWTQKEALLKWSGQGLADDMREVLAGSHPGVSTHESPDGRYVFSVCGEVKSKR